MPIKVNKSAFVGSGSVTISLSQMFGTTAASSNPAYLVLSVLDRDEYTATATHETGSLLGNGQTLSLTGIGDDGRGAGIVFAYQPSNGRYYNGTYGYFDQLKYTSSGSADDVANLSLFGTGNLADATAYGANAYSMIQLNSVNYIGSVTVATQASFSGSIPTQATPKAIAATAMSFIGRAWNMNGCWVLASTIAAESGAALPVHTTAVGVPGMANNEWTVAYNGPAGQSGDWEAMVRTGDVVVIGYAGGGGHVTTCVSGSGSSAMLVDNITYIDSQGSIVNAANDGSSSDIIVASPHAASQEWSSALDSSVVIYRLDTPVVSAAVTSVKLACLASQSIGSWFTASDPANRAIVKWQVYDTAASDSLLLNGTTYNAHSAASALTSSSLTSISLHAGSVQTNDTLQVRAYNGAYWGDWQSLSVAVTSAPPTLAAHIAKQTWTAGKAVALTLPAGTFSDPEGQTLTYKATLSSGQALPSWLKFNASTRTFSGVAPSTPQNLTIKVAATDPARHSASQTFAASVVTPTVATTGSAGRAAAPKTMAFIAHESGSANTFAANSNAATKAWPDQYASLAGDAAWLAKAAADVQTMSSIDMAAFRSHAGSANLPIEPPKYPGFADEASLSRMTHMLIAPS